MVDGLVEPGVGVDVRAEPHAEALHERDDVLLGEVAGAIEAHVLDEVRQSALVVVFEYRSGLHGEAKLGPSLRLPVRAHVIPQAIRERPGPNLRIDGNRLGQRRGLRAGGWDGLLGRRHGRGHGDGGDQTHEQGAEVRGHGTAWHFFGVRATVASLRL